jgi:hypothetical protein
MGVSTVTWRAKVGVFAGGRAGGGKGGVQGKTKVIKCGLFLLLLLLLGSPTGLNKDGGSPVLNNKMSHISNGNRRNDTMKIASWNKGPAFLGNKMEEIEQLICDHHPHILGITEANFRKGHNTEEVELLGYKLHMADTIDNTELGYSRVVMYIKEDIQCKVRNDLMSSNISSIWLEVKLGPTKFIVGQAYREWALWIGDQTTRTPDAQMTRWILFLDQWE